MMKNMEVREAINWLVQIKDKYIRYGDEGFDAKRRQALDMGIESLERYDPIKPEAVTRVWNAMKCEYEFVPMLPECKVYYRCKCGHIEDSLTNFCSGCGVQWTS